MRKIYIGVSFIIVVIAILFFVNKPQHSHVSQSNRPLCQFEHSSCIYLVDEVEVLLDADPGIIKTEHETMFSIKASDDHELVIHSARLEGKDMYMGVVPLFFKKINGVYQAPGLLGACMHDKMVWVMFLDVTIDGKKQTLVYEFYSQQD